MSVMTTKEELIAFYEDEKYWPETAESHICIGEETLRCGEGFTQQIAFDFDELQALPAGTRIKIEFGYVWDEMSDFSAALESYFKRWRKEQVKKAKLPLQSNATKTTKPPFVQRLKPLAEKYFKRCNHVSDSIGRSH